MLEILVAMSLAVGLVGCNSANSEVSHVEFGHSKGIVTTGNIRLVTERVRRGHPIVCTEPSPDYLIAFGNKSGLKQSTPTAAGARSLEVNIDKTETGSEGEGREAGVLALRDGLYTACQNYANGVIGQDAYSIILSQYGNLLVALVGKDAAAANIEVSGPQAALSAMTVGCISSYDTTRSAHQSNLLLTRTFCSQLLKDVATRGLASKPRTAAAGGAAKKAQVVKPAPVVAQASGSNVTTTTTTNTVVK
ncbi:hypothetical protein ACQKKX_00935 [Neorhizobium sp. NPDC001467]|uniref:hypothetical protein n=1 Tax=Neorhizobium sp. NPDC001467 TaxID=3390595 RepID=UPI003D0128E6